MAQIREGTLRETGHDANFIHVLHLGGVKPADAGLAAAYNWVDFTRSGDRAASFRELARRLELSLSGQWVRQPQQEVAVDAGAGRNPGAVPHRPASSAGNPSAEAVPPRFRNREDELDHVLRGLTVAGGRSFWLVTAPPKLGKTWFLNEVRSQLDLEQPGGWITRVVDVRKLPNGARDDAGLLLAELFGRETPVTGSGTELLDVVKDMLRSRKAWLCLLDHAELLSKPAVAMIRSCLSRVDLEVQKANVAGVRLGLIVATRQESEWQGVIPRPRLSKLSLSGFRVEIVQTALQELAAAMGRDGYSGAEARQDAGIVFRLTEGLPALLVRCLHWIVDEVWVGFDRLETQQLFEEISTPFIMDELLAPDSLLPKSATRADGELAVVEQAYRVLVPYRLFTRSHLQHYLESDPDLKAAMERQAWSLEDLWAAVSATAPLVRLDELWKVVNPAIRRLLHRHYYAADEQWAMAHNEARKFVEAWAARQNDKEQVFCLIECLWHEAMALRVRPSAEMQERLIQSAASLFTDIRESNSFTITDLRNYAADRMADDSELQEIVAHIPGLFEDLVTIVRDPQQGHRSQEASRER